ncbi:MAG: universal stress protein [Gammaproteobacteria bacterium]|nr:universal stress protein [Gammaproteobacteria bacterium]
MPEKDTDKPGYHHILAAVDLSPDADTVAGRALALAHEFDARLTILHVTANLMEEPAYEFMTTLPMDVDIQSEVVAQANRSLEDLCRRLGDEHIHHLVEVNTPKHGILDVAQREEADLIVMGNHGVHGLELLLGSTANGVLHHAPCDILAVKVGG